MANKRSYNGHNNSTRESGEKHGLLHTTEIIERGAEFGLEIVLSSSIRPSTLDQLTKLLTRGLEDEGVGASKSRGLGAVKVKDVRIEEITPETIEKRALELIPNSSDVFSVQLISPIINDTTERSLEASTLLEGARRAYSWCFKEGKPALPEVRRINEKYSYDIFGGWSLREERLRRNAVSIVSGSAFYSEWTGWTTKNKFRFSVNHYLVLSIMRLGAINPMAMDKS